MSESECRMVVGFGERCGRAIHVLPVVSLPSLLEQRRQRSPFSGGPCLPSSQRRTVLQSVLHCTDDTATVSTLGHTDTAPHPA